MIGTHKTKEGQVLLLTQMTDDHLLNTIKLYCRNVADARKSFEGGWVPTFEAAVVGAKPKYQFDTQEELVEFTQSYIVKLAPYVFLAALRGLNIQDALESAFPNMAYTEVDLVSTWPKRLTPQVSRIVPSYDLEPLYIGGYYSDDN